MNAGIVQCETTILRQPVLGLRQMAPCHRKEVQYNVREGQCVDILYLPTNSNGHLGTHEYCAGLRPHIPLHSLGSHTQVSESLNGPDLSGTRSF